MNKTGTLILFFLSLSSLFVQCKSSSQSNKQTPQFVGTIDSENDYQDQEEAEYYDRNHIRYENHVYAEGIKSVQLYSQGWELSQPVIRLNTEEQLKLSFDQLDSALTNYSYTFIHCNANWEPSGLVFPEYINGLSEDFIQDNFYSRGTFQRYIHYNLYFPNPSIRFILSGNYIVKVWVTDNEEDIVLTRRFMVVDNKVNIQANIHPATNVADRFQKQEVDFTLNSTNYQMTNPYKDLKVVILQNYRWDNAATNLRPVFVKENSIEFDLDDQNVFNGGNEFRFFNIKDLQFRSTNVDRITYTNQVNNVYLTAQKPRTTQVYLDQPDLNGQFVVKRDGSSWDSDVDSDYAFVHFKLQYPQVITNGDIYVFGELTGWNFNKDAKMTYNYNSQAYEVTLYLKQGYYNYEFIYLKDGEAKADEKFIEGSHYQAENAYTILVYHRGISDDYDKLIGLQNFSFPPNR